jgi:alkylhydroperoxidase family enzyme
MSTQVVFDRVLAGQPDVLSAMNETHDAARAAVDDALLSVCEARVAMLLGGEVEPSFDRDVLADLPSWPTSPRIDSTLRACLAFTEQFVIDVATMDDALVDAVSDALGPDGLLNFTNALLVVEQRQRLRLAWERLIPEVAS